MDPVSLLIGLFSLILTIVGVYIAWRQWRESRLKKPPVSETSVALDNVKGRIASDLLVSVFTAPPSAGHLIGRKSLIRSLSQDISTHRFNALVIEGIGGIGKTALAAAISEQLGSVMWVNCSGEEVTFENFVLSVVGLALKEGREFARPVFFSPNQSKTAKTREMIRILSSGEYRIVFDDFHLVGDQSLKTLLRAVLEQCQKIALVFTSRIRPDFLEDPTIRILPKFVELEGLDLDSAIHYLRYLGEVYPQLSSANDETLKRIWPYAGMGHPIALKIFAALTRYRSIPDLLTQLEQYHDKLGEWIRKLFKELSKGEVLVLCCLSIFRVPVSEQAIFHLLGKKGSQESINAVINRFLIERDTTGELYLHPLLRDYAHNLLTPEQGQLYHNRAGDYFEGLKMTNSTTLRFGLEAYYHYQQSQADDSLVRIVSKIKRSLFDAGQYDRLTELLREIEPYIYQSIAKEATKRQPILFIGGGEVAYGIVKALDPEQYITVVIDRPLSVALREIDFQILLDERCFRNTDRIITILRNIGDAINSSSKARLPWIITDYYGFDAEMVFGEAETLGYRILPNKEAAVVACDKVAFWQHFHKISGVDSVLIPRTWIEVPQAVSQLLNEGARSSVVMSFINRVKVDIQHVGFPCVLKLAITELGFGQSIIQGDDEGEIYNALRFAIKQSHEHGINPGDRIILEKEISQPFSEVVQIAVQHHDPITGPRITFAPPILVKHISKGNLASDDRTQAITGPFVLDFSIQCDIRQMPSLVQTNHSQMQALTAKMINSLGTSPGIYGVTFFITDTGLWIPDDIPVKAEDTMFVTNTAQLFSAAELLTMCLTDKPVQASAIQELQYAGGTRTILWRENRLAELESIEGQAEARAISGIHSIEIYNSKIDLRPLRLMGIINARLPKDASLLDIVNCLDEALSKVRIVPHM